MIIAGCAFLPSSALAQNGLFNFTFEDVDNSTGFGFDDPVLGAERRATLQAVNEYLDSVFALPDESVQANITIGVSQNLNNNTLASAGPFFTGTNNEFLGGNVADVLLSGTPPGAGSEQAQATFNFGTNFNSGLDPVQAGEFDLFTVALHEFSHALGFISILDADGTSGFAGDPNLFSTFDRQLVTGTGTRLFNDSAEFQFGADSDGDGVADVLESNNVFFDTDLNDASNELIQIYAPTTFQDGSSLSHVDGNEFPGSVTAPTIAANTEIRQFNAQELAIFGAIGFTVVAVPEPASAVFCFLAIAGFATCRRRTA